ncbi:MAG TPA: hypothetical protein VF839_10940 [Clostridium sp.]
MLEISLIDLIGRTIPEALFFIWAFYTLSQTKIQVKRYFLSVIIMIILNYGAKLLPIHYGVHSLLIIVGLIITNNIINKINIIKSILITLGVFIIEFICEIINLLIIQYLFKADINYVFSHSELKVLYALPSFLFFICSILLLNFLICKIVNKKVLLDKKE